MFALFVFICVSFVFCSRFCVCCLMSRFTVYRNNQMMISYFVCIFLLCLRIFLSTNTFQDLVVCLCSSFQDGNFRMARVEPSAGAGWRRMFWIGTDDDGPSFVFYLLLDVVSCWLSTVM